MFVFLTHRRLRPVTWEQFRQAWEPDEVPEEAGDERVYHVRSLKDENEIISFGIADMSRKDLERLGEEGDDAERQRQERMAQFVEWTGVNGVFEVIEETRLGG